MWTPANGEMVKALGVDIVDVARLERILAASHGSRFVDRVYTPTEIAYCQRRARAAEHFAVRFAAKEAVFKMLGTGWAKGVGWKDVEVRNEPSGAPGIDVHGKARELFEASGGGKILLSLSHTASLAIAQAVWVTHASED